MKSTDWIRLVFIFFCGFLFFLSCSLPQEEETTETKTIVPVDPNECIQRIIAIDDSLGNIRNHACETLSLAKTIRNYTDALAQLDYSNCPSDFTKAFELHRFAWIQMIPLTEKYPKLRGEMHDLFDQIKITQDSVEYNTLLKNIWDTWVVVENETIKQE